MQESERLLFNIKAVTKEIIWTGKSSRLSQKEKQTRLHSLQREVKSLEAALIIAKTKEHEQQRASQNRD